MIFIRRFGRDHESAPDDHRTEDVGERFDGVGNQRVRMADDAGGEFARGQNGVDHQPEKGGAKSAFQPVGRHKAG